MATAALAAQPPSVVTKALARILVSGAGKPSIRKIWSSTATPAQTMFCARDGIVLLSSTLAGILQPRTDNMISNSNRIRNGQAIRMLAQQHCRHLVAVKPAGIFQFSMIDLDIGGQRLRMAADHQRGGKRPRLRGEISNVATGDPGFFAGFPPHGVFDGLAGLKKAG